MRKNHNHEAFRISIEEIKHCNNGCEEKYHDLLRSEITNVSLRQRVSENLEFAKIKSAEYLEAVNKDDLF